MERIFTSKVTYMELDSRNILRLYRICLHNIKKNRVILTKRVVAYIYLYGAYTYMVLYFSYNIHVADKPISFFLVIMRIIGAYLLYVLINHLLVRCVIQNRILLIFDLLSLIMLICIAITESWIS